MLPNRGSRWQEPGLGQCRGRTPERDYRPDTSNCVSSSHASSLPEQAGCLPWAAAASRREEVIRLIKKRLAKVERAQKPRKLAVAAAAVEKYVRGAELGCKSLRTKGLASGCSLA